jgi:hypothetical protein
MSKEEPSQPLEEGKPCCRFFWKSGFSMINENYFLIKRKFWFGFRKVFLFYFERKILSKSCEKFRNVILFTDYIKFDSQTLLLYILF